jgi:hypothetical protein
MVWFLKRGGHALKKKADPSAISSPVIETH